MAETTFYLHPDSNYGPFQFVSPSAYGNIDDPHDSINPSDYCPLVANSDGSTYRNCRGSWGLTAPTSGVSINWIRVHLAGACKSQIGGSWIAEPSGWVLVRPGGSSTYYASSLRTIVAGFSADGSYGVTSFPNVVSAPPYGHAYWQFNTNPVTATAWTVADLQSLVVSFVSDTSITTSPASIGIKQVPPGTAGSSFYARAGAIYVEVNANTAAASIEEKRAMGSAYLRFLRNPTAVFDMKVPLAAAPLEVGSVVPVTHALGPTSDGEGWGREQWARRYAMILDKQLDPTGRTWALRAMDMRGVHSRLWFPARTDLAYTEEGQGIPYLDAGGGRSLSRNSKAYEQRQEDDPLFVEIPIDKERWSPKGVGVFYGTTRYILNNSFSQGSGSTFTNWLNTTNGSGAIGESTTAYLFDANGLRRCCVLDSVGTAGSDWARVGQGVTPGAGYVRYSIALKRNTTGGTYLVRLIRSSDGYYWNDATGAFQSGAVSNYLSTSGEIETFYSKQIPTAAGVTYTLYVYVQGDTVNRGACWLYFADLYGGASKQNADAHLPPHPTTTATVGVSADELSVANPASARAWDTTRGTFLGVFEFQGNHPDLATSHAYTAVLNSIDGSNYDNVYFASNGPTAGNWVFQLYRGGTSYAGLINASGSSGSTALPLKGDAFRVALRWQATDGELGGADYACRGYLQRNDEDPVTVDFTAAAGSSGAATLYLGSRASGNGALQSYWRLWEVSPYVLTDEEVYRRLGV